jgi:carboxyl-terminal processing protease
MSFFLPRSSKQVGSISARAKKINDDNEDEQPKGSNPLDGVKSSVDEAVKKIIDKIPPPILAILTSIWNKLAEILPGLRIALFSFFLGSVLTVAAILVPAYSSIATVSEPVQLFETILADLEAGYVDPVDTNKLFETGVSAMLRSLDPYTEFEAREDSQQLTESIQGRYGGVGLVIAGATPKDIVRMQKAAAPESSSKLQKSSGSKLLPKDAVKDSSQLEDGDMSTNSKTASDFDDDDDDFSLQSRKEEKRQLSKARERGIRVVSAFEGYAFDYGMRVGDKLVGVDDVAVTQDTSVEDVRNVLRGEPGTMVTIKFDRVGVEGTQELTMPRRIVQLRDVKLATFVGDPKDGIGYIALSGFASNAGNEVRQAILGLERAAQELPEGGHSLKGLILDLRGNPGGLLTSAVDVASLLVPKDSDIVSARGRGFPGVTYRSRMDPILDPTTKLTILVNRGTASAAEIVSGAVQDLDAGVIVGKDRTFGKGLVQNVEDLPFNTALKFTVAKYYTPSGRCIQDINYSEGGGLKEDGKFRSAKVAERDRQTFYTKSGRIVKDGGGVEADYKVAAPQASALEVTLLRSEVLGEFAAQWSKNNGVANNFEITDKIYKDFQDFVDKKSVAGDIKLESIYSGALTDLKRALKESGYKGSEKEVDVLQANIVREVKNDFEKYKDDIKEDISNSILARYLPESMILQRGLKTDKQVAAAVKLMTNEQTFDKVLAKGSSNERINGAGRLNLASADVEKESTDRGSLKVEW